MIKMTFGIQPEHIEIIEAEIKVWKESPIVKGLDDYHPEYGEGFWKIVGTKVGWSPFTIALAYLSYKNKSK